MGFEGRVELRTHQAELDAHILAECDQPIISGRPPGVVHKNDEVKMGQRLRLSRVHRWTVPQPHWNACHTPIIGSANLSTWREPNWDPAFVSSSYATEKVHQGRHPVTASAADDRDIHEGSWSTIYAQGCHDCRCTQSEAQGVPPCPEEKAMPRFAQEAWQEQQHGWETAPALQVAWQMLLLLRQRSCTLHVQNVCTYMSYVHMEQCNTCNACMCLGERQILEHAIERSQTSIIFGPKHVQAQSFIRKAYRTRRWTLTQSSPPPTDGPLLVFVGRPASDCCSARNHGKKASSVKITAGKTAQL